MRLDQFNSIILYTGIHVEVVRIRRNRVMLCRYNPDGTKYEYTDTDDMVLDKMIKVMDGTCKFIVIPEMPPFDREVSLRRMRNEAQQPLPGVQVKDWSLGDGT